MNPAQEARGEPCRCISHEFLRSASVDPGRIAVVHARGGLRICRELREASRREDDPAGGDEERLLESSRECAFPPVYSGDVCFTYGEVSSAVESLSRRIRRVLDGGDDPGLVRPKGYIYREGDPEIQISEPLGASRRMLQIVGVHIAPSVEYIVAVLSILRCGEAFLPLDPSWPRERLLSIAARSRTELVIRCETSFCTDRSRQSNETDWSADGHKFSVLCFSMGSVVAENVASVLDWPCETQKPRLFCYLMYTSGSTGKPKGVCGTEIGLVNRFLWMQQLFPACRRDILLFKTPISFIDHLQEFLTAILSCTSLIIPPFDYWKADPFYLVDILKVYCISRLVIVPSLARAILPSYERSQWANVQKTLRLLVLSGEVLSLSLWKILHKLLPGTIILNLYGSTEVSGDCMYFDCSHLPKILETEALSSVPIGVPISNCDINLLQQGIPGEGEICVGGSCLFVGYFDDLSHGILSKGPTPLSFETGDFAKCLQSGDLLFIGRKDRTIKVNGQRIALEEIEDALREHPEVSDAAVVSVRHEESSDQIYLKAYIVLTENDEIQEKQFSSFDKKTTDKCLAISIRSWLVRKLPPFMIPNFYSFVESLPKSSSGKVNYTILGRSSSISEHPMKEFDESQCSDHLQIIKQAFCDSLLIEEINDHDDFFSLGGSSISAALLAHKLGIDMRLLYRFPSPVGLLDALVDRKGPLGTAFLPDDLQTKRQKLDNSAKEVSAVQPKVLVNSDDSSHGIRSLRQLDSVKFSDPKTAAFDDHSLQLSKLNLPSMVAVGLAGGMA
ncbi:hypothetical protein Taro_005655 [Colocasia esculenta]|uniref:4-coumarate--CoA ligase n=1 Tax=Colocasia esculenta TaxID=4460 RepID=A0A843TQG3_COLES|nr:hypothetical protein [Colocasia esculenta]